MNIFHLIIGQISERLRHITHKDKYDRKNSFWNNMDNGMDWFICIRIGINCLFGKRRLPIRIGGEIMLFELFLTWLYYAE